jgi:GT2 family glycosyltransferase
VLVDTLQHLQEHRAHLREIIVVDQTPCHAMEVEQELSRMDREAAIRWLRLDRPSIPCAMNLGLLAATGDIVLFLDDDILPLAGLVEAHARAHGELGVALVAGRVVQPWDADTTEVGSFRPIGFSSRTRTWVGEFIGCNFSVKRAMAVAMGGFDENFVHVAYRFERDFSDRLLAAGGRIVFEPDATVKHLKASEGGTRTFGHHLRTARPSHAVGEYYYLLGMWWRPARLGALIARPVRAVATTHHLRRPWWIPATLTAEVLGFAWGLALRLRGPRYLRPSAQR